MKFAKFAVDNIHQLDAKIEYLYFQQLMPQMSLYYQIIPLQYL